MKIQKFYTKNYKDIRMKVKKRENNFRIWKINSRKSNKIYKKRIQE